jgi:hypothetical protein
VGELLKIIYYPTYFDRRVLEGLQEGDQVVVSGQFLIDSESNLQASLRRLEPPPEPSGQPHAH